MLADEGKLALDNDIRRFLPNYPTQAKGITIEHQAGDVRDERDRLLLDQVDAELRFVKNADRAVQQAMLHQDGRDIPAINVPN